MHAASCTPKSIQRFLTALEIYQATQNPFVNFSNIKPLENLNHIDSLILTKKEDLNNLPKCAVIKLNGGLGTSMGCLAAKSSLPVKGSLCFLDIIAPVSYTHLTLPTTPYV